MVQIPAKSEHRSGSFVARRALSRHRLGLRSPQAVEASFNGDVEGFAELFPRYRSELRARRVVDFDEQIYGAIELLLREPEVRRQAQRRCPARYSSMSSRT